MLCTKRLTPFAFVAGLLLVVGGCAGTHESCTGFHEYVHNHFKVGPNYCKPAAPVADDWIDSVSPRLEQSSDPNCTWWEVFNDPTLNRLIVMAYEQNISLREAGFRVAESQARRDFVVGRIFPQTQQIFADYTRTQNSTQTANFAGFGAVPPNFVNFDSWRVGGALTWELDFWGRYRRAIESADASLDASVEGYDDAIVLLVSEVASTYVDYRTFELRLDYARNNVVLQRESARIAEVRRQAAAIDAEVDAPQAKSNLARTEAAIQSLEVAERETQNRLSVLLGMPPHDLRYLLSGSRGVPKAPEKIAVDVPASLLRRRPDIRRAERLVAAQSALIGVAQADLYPSISITGNARLDAADVSKLFNGGAFAGSIGPSFRWDVLNYGRLVNLVKVEDALLQQRIAGYQQLVLQADQEAEDAIIGALLYKDQIGYLQTSVKEAAEATRVTRAKYEAGQIDFNRVFTVEQLLLQQQDQLAISQGNSANSIVRLYRAMGGGWQIRLGAVAGMQRLPAVEAEAPFEAPQPGPMEILPKPPEPDIAPLAPEPPQNAKP